MLYDIAYPSQEAVDRGEGIRIEVKETSYYHSWQSDEEPKSRQRMFGIEPAYSTMTPEPNDERKRQSDLYVFCLNTGNTKGDYDPLMMEHWTFYMVKTADIDANYGKLQKKISLSRLENELRGKNRPGVHCCAFEQLKETVDSLFESDAKENSAMDA